MSVEAYAVHLLCCARHSVSPLLTILRYPHILRSHIREQHHPVAITELVSTVHWPGFIFTDLTLDTALSVTIAKIL